MSLNAQQRELVKSISEEVVDDAVVKFTAAMDKFGAQLETDIVPRIVKETMSNMGADVTNPLALQADFKDIRDRRLRREEIQSYGVRAVVTGLVGFIGTALYYFIKSKSGN